MKRTYLDSLISCDDFLQSVVNINYFFQFGDVREAVLKSKNPSSSGEHFPGWLPPPPTPPGISVNYPCLASAAPCLAPVPRPQFTVLSRISFFVKKFDKNAPRRHRQKKVVTQYGEGDMELPLATISSHLHVSAMSI